MAGLETFLVYWVLGPLGVVGVFFVLVLIHELGHFAVGRYFGLRVEEFAIGFGPIVFSRYDRQDTRWSWRAVPFGGFVKFAGDSDAGSMADPAKSAMDARADALATLALWKRALVVAAGPAANLILALGLFWAQVLSIGQAHLDPVIGAVVPGSAAAQAGLQPGDKVLAAGARSIDSFAGLDLVFESSLGQEVDLRIERDGTPQDLSIEALSGPGHGAASSGILAHTRLEITEVEFGSPAADMDLRVGDLVVGFDGQLLTTAQSFFEARRAKIGQPMTLFIERDGLLRETTGTPEARMQVWEGGQITAGVFGFAVRPYIDWVRPGPLAALALAGQQMRQFATLIFKLPGQFINKQRDLDDLGGPVRIAEEVGRVVVFAPTILLFLTGLLSLQLGLINLFPVPILDGGHLMLYGAEAVARRPLPPRVVAWLHRFGLVLILSFFFLVTTNDLARLLWFSPTP